MGKFLHTGRNELRLIVSKGLARISHRKKIVNDSYPVYEYEPAGGEGVDAYILSSGIKINHTEFEGRASWGITIPPNDIDDDVDGYGTHCAGIVGSRKYGVAKAVNFIAVKVLGPHGSGSNSDVIAGVLWSAERAAAKLAAAKAEYAATGRTDHKGSIAGMPIGGGRSLVINRVVNKAVDSGLLIAVGAGSDGDACYSSPASAEKAVTAGASNILDEMCTWSGWGQCVDVFAPGEYYHSLSQNPFSDPSLHRSRHYLHLYRKRYCQYHLVRLLHILCPHHRSPRILPLYLPIRILQS